MRRNAVSNSIPETKRSVSMRFEEGMFGECSACQELTRGIGE